ncbi:MAG: hypothetical protein K2G55_01270 [Lachnospiraceae bacterium]|nr:hypothetical protein [Lachnospiraceae bacterium]MDE7204196.1 hypothetical protein [Lachnospiraceae bacterium]
MLVYGDNIWALENIEREIEEFKEIYDNRPIIDNRGGMSSTHLFWSWYAMKTLKPQYIIESGVWKGQGTWLFEKACPNAQIFSIDINLNHREYISERVKYFSIDFSCIDWSFIKDKEKTVIFFDDHQNAYDRLMQMKFMGFQQALFEDNYPETEGDCYSLKKVLLGVGFEETDKIIIPPNHAHSMYFKENVNTYFEFPPIYKTDHVRWGGVWDDVHYPTRKPILDKVDTEMQKILYAESKDYTWICFCKLRG